MKFGHLTCGPLTDSAQWLAIWNRENSVVPLSWTHLVSPQRVDLSTWRKADTSIGRKNGGLPGRQLPPVRPLFEGFVCSQLSPPPPNTHAHLTQSVLWWRRSLGGGSGEHGRILMKTKASASNLQECPPLTLLFKEKLDVPWHPSACLGKELGICTSLQHLCLLWVVACKKW